MRAEIIILHIESYHQLEAMRGIDKSVATQHDELKGVSGCHLFGIALLKAKKSNIIENTRYIRRRH